MKTLYVQATNRFPDNIRLFDEYLSFTMRSKYSNADIMEIYEQILKVHFKLLFFFFFCTNV